MKNKVLSLHQDMKDGTLKRMKPSKNPWDMNNISEDNEIDDDAVYIELDPP